jgi:hypothetical protein
MADLDIGDRRHFPTRMKDPRCLIGDNRKASAVYADAPATQERLRLVRRLFWSDVVSFFRKEQSDRQIRRSFTSFSSIQNPRPVSERYINPLLPKRSAEFNRQLIQHRLDGLVGKMA